jgi:hypothetical protein
MTAEIEPTSTNEELGDPDEWGEEEYDEDDECDSLHGDEYLSAVADLEGLMLQLDQRELEDE